MRKDRLVDELLGLRKGRGATLTKIAGSPMLLEAFGTDNPQTVISKLSRALDKLGSDVEANALRNALALHGKAHHTLTQRRNQFAEENQKHVDTVESYENRMAVELVAIIRLEHVDPWELQVVVNGRDMHAVVTCNGAAVDRLPVTTRRRGFRIDVPPEVALHLQGMTIEFVGSAPPPNHVFLSENADREPPPIVRGAGLRGSAKQPNFASVKKKRASFPLTERQLRFLSVTWHSKES